MRAAWAILMIKAAAGGGGRGIRVVQDEAELRAQMLQAGPKRAGGVRLCGVYLERYLPRARHIENAGAGRRQERHPSL